MIRMDCYPGFGYFTKNVVVGGVVFHVYICGVD